MLRSNSITGASAGVSVFKCRPDMTMDNNDIHDTGCAGILSNLFLVQYAYLIALSLLCLIAHYSTFICFFLKSNFKIGIEIRPGCNPLIVRNKIHNTRSAGFFSPLSLSPLFFHPSFTLLLPFLPYFPHPE